MSDSKPSSLMRLKTYPKTVGSLQSKVDQLDVRELKDAGVDRYGTSKDYLKSCLPALGFLYELWHRVELEGVENLPAAGPGLIAVNHAGLLPLDGAMIVTGALKQMDRPRLIRCVVDHYGASVPFVSIFFARTGQVIGTEENVEYMLEHDELVLVFPEGMKGLKKTYGKRYKLEPFSPGFVELAIKHRAPILPAAVVGSEEMKISLWNSDRLAKLTALPYVPVTPQLVLSAALAARAVLWPLRRGNLFGAGLAAALLLPPPSKFRIRIGPPIDLSGVPLETLDDPAAVREIVESVRAKIQSMLDEGLKKRPAPFF